jgi:hypothetical protein
MGLGKIEVGWFVRPNGAMIAIHGDNSDYLGVMR